MNTFLTLYFIINSFLCGYYMATNTDELDALDKLFMFFLIMWFAGLFISVYYILMILLYIFKSLKRIFYDQEI